MSQNINPFIKARTIGLQGPDSRKVADVSKGGLLGARGFHAGLLDTATPATFLPTVIVVLQMPRMYKNRPQFCRMIKTLLESHAETVSGIDFGYNMETDDTPAGHDGQQLQNPTNPRRTAVNPEFTIPELKGNVVWDGFRIWHHDVRHPDTHASMSMLAAPDGDEIPEPFEMSKYTMTMIALQYDETLRPENLMAAALYSNMFPQDPGGMIGFERQVGQTKVMRRQITFTGHVYHDDGVYLLGQAVAHKIALTNAKYNLKPTDIIPYNTAADLVTGMSDQIADSGIEAEVNGDIA